MESEATLIAPKTRFERSVHRTLLLSHRVDGFLPVYVLLRKTQSVYRFLRNPKLREILKLLGQELLKSAK